MAATDERAIHEFPTGTIDDNSLLIMDRPTLTPGEYETEKFAITNLALKLLGGLDFPNNLDTEEQDIFGAINEVNAKAMNIAAEYDETDSYSKGDYCIYQNAAYRCIKATGTTTGTFVAADWTQIKVLSEVKANTEAINVLESGKADKSTTYTKTEVDAKLANVAVSYNSNSKLTNNSVNFIRSGNVIYICGVFRGQTILANESIWVLHDIHISSLANTIFIPIVGNFSTNYIGYLKVENSSNNIRIYSDVALDNPSLIFVNGVIPLN